MTSKAKRKYRQHERDVFIGVGKELYLIGLYAVQEATGLDPHYKPGKRKYPWQKRWGEK